MKARDDGPRMTTEKGKRNHLWSHFRMTPEDLQRMHTAQQGRCAICQERPSRLVIDHCHVTRRVRGLLCDRCNTHLRAIEDRDFVAQAKVYLSRDRVWTFEATAYNAVAREQRHAFKERLQLPGNQDRTVPLVTWRGIAKTRTEWARHFGVVRTTVCNYIRRHVSIDHAFAAIATVAESPRSQSRRRSPRVETGTLF